MVADIYDYLNDKSKACAGFTPTGLDKTVYLKIVDTVIDGYSKEKLISDLPKTEQDYTTYNIHANCRVAVCLALLLSNGLKKDWFDVWEGIMDAASKAFYLRNSDAMNDFAVKDFMLSYRLMKNYISKKKAACWMARLRLFIPHRNYRFVNRGDGAFFEGNINIYNMAAEALREAEGLCDTEKYFDLHWPAQLKNFDENGMYRDPGCPMLYDLTTRVQIQVMFMAGYNGKYKTALDNNLKKAALCGLLYQSAAFEFPFGGRSNQYLFNEGLLASNFEYEAARYNKEGNLKLAGAFKRAAHLAVLAIGRWLDQNPPKHIKNFYTDHRHGTEGYGYYDKYMATLGSFIVPAFIAADDEIKEQPCPAELGGYVIKTSDSFHKIFAKCSSYSIEIDTNADFLYDCTGLGAVHKTGVPTELALSHPMTETPNYYIDQRFKKMNLAIGPGVQKEGRVYWLADQHTANAKQKIDKETPDGVSFSVSYETEGGMRFLEKYNLTAQGVSIEASSNEDATMLMRVPVLVSNGKDFTTVTAEPGAIKVMLGSHRHVILSSFPYKIDDDLAANRNGEYKYATFTGDRTVRVQLVLE